MTDAPVKIGNVCTPSAMSRRPPMFYGLLGLPLKFAEGTGSPPWTRVG